MVNRPPFDRDPPPPGGFDPRYGGQRGPDPRFGDAPRYDDDPRFSRDPRDSRDPREAYGHDPDPYDSRTAPPRSEVRRGGMGRSTMLLLGLGALLLIGAILFALSLDRSGPGSDALDSAENKQAAASGPEERCAAPATYDKIKRELFRQAGAQRGSDAAAFDRLAGYAAIRVSDPVLREEDEGLERVSCSGTVALDLPPGVQVVGGRQSLSANLQYNLQPAADRSGDVVTLTGAEPITAPLATLARVASAVETAAAPPVPGEAPPSEAPAPADLPPSPQQPAPAPIQAPRAAPAPLPAPAPRVTERTTARPSFNCANARTRGERAVCSSPELASLDRQMASRFYGSVREGNATQRALLERTRGSFLRYRDRCTDNSCVAGAYRDRIREINDIMADRWVAPR
jgi:hypothetical protein